MQPLEEVSVPYSPMPPVSNPSAWATPQPRTPGSASDTAAQGVQLDTDVGGVSTSQSTSALAPIKSGSPVKSKSSNGMLEGKQCYLEVSL